MGWEEQILVRCASVLRGIPSLSQLLAFLATGPLCVLNFSCRLAPLAESERCIISIVFCRGYLPLGLFLGNGMKN